MTLEDRQIHAILGDDRERSMHNAERYRDYLAEHLSLPILVTGTEDFPWEEPYIIGGWDKDEYEELKKSNPSYTDDFELLSLEPPNRYEDVMAKVRRLSDGKQFEIGVS